MNFGFFNPAEAFFNTAQQLGNAIRDRQELPRQEPKSMQYYMNNGKYANARQREEIDPDVSNPFPNPDYFEYEDRLKELYKKYYYLSDRDFIKTAQHQVNPNIPPPPTEAVIQFLRRQPGRQIVDFKYKHDNPFNSIKKPGIYQIDIVFFIPQTQHLYIIEMNSRKVWVMPLKDRTEESCKSAFLSWYYKEDINDYVQNYNPNPNIYAKRRVVAIMSDDDSTFNSTKDFCDTEGIQWYVKEPTEHKILYILERSVSTIKKILYKRLVEFDMSEPSRWSRRNHRNYIIDGPGFSANQWFKEFNEHVYSTVTDYNDKPHPSLHGYTPNEVYHSPILQKKVLVESINRNVDNEFRLDNNQRFRIGDLVRFKERRKTFDKMIFWSDKVYKIINKNRFSYQIGNVDGTPTDLSKYRFKHYDLELVQRATNRADYQRAYYRNRYAWDKHLREILKRPNPAKGIL